MAAAPAEVVTRIVAVVVGIAGVVTIAVVVGTYGVVVAAVLARVVVLWPEEAAWTTGVGTAILIVDTAILVVGTAIIVVGTATLVVSTATLVVGIAILVVGTAILVVGTPILVVGARILVVGTEILAFGTAIIVVGTATLDVVIVVAGCREVTTTLVVTTVVGSCVALLSVRVGLVGSGTTTRVDAIARLDETRVKRGLVERTMDVVVVTKDEGY